jgi:hypothetical protein
MKRGLILNTASPIQRLVQFVSYVSVRLDGKNYSYLSCVMRNFLKGKKM